MNNQPSNANKKENELNTILNKARDEGYDGNVILNLNKTIIR
jgi:hypothetical protein